jgi:hypothetical protein
VLIPEGMRVFEFEVVDWARARGAREARRETKVRDFMTGGGKERAMKE